MDKSETYIKMRLAAIPDLGMGTPSLQPFHFGKAIPDFSKQVLIDRKGDWYHITKPNNECQLERQDQLQEMVDITTTGDLFYLFDHEFLDIGYGGANVVCPKWLKKDWSMEHL